MDVLTAARPRRGRSSLPPVAALHAAVAALLAAVAAGCYAPEEQECTLRCAADNGCPSEAVCGMDGFCHPAGSAVVCRPTDGPAPSNDGARPADARPLDAPAPRIDAPQSCTAGQPCDDDDPCTLNDVCDSSGARCTGTRGTPLVYRYRSAAGEWYHTTATTPPAGFSAAGTPFRLAHAASDSINRVDLYQIHSSNAVDYMLSQNANEAVDPPFSYTLESTVGPVYVTSRAGTRALHRYVQPAPLRHTVAIDPADAPAGFSDDGMVVGHVCPP